MNITDPSVILMALALAFICGSVGYLAGAVMKASAVREARFQAWREAERTYRERAIKELEQSL